MVIRIFRPGLLNILSLYAVVYEPLASGTESMALFARYLDHFERALREAPYGWVAKTKRRGTKKKPTTPGFGRDLFAPRS